MLGVIVAPEASSRRKSSASASSSSSPPRSPSPISAASPPQQTEPLCLATAAAPSAAPSRVWTARGPSSTVCGSGGGGGVLNVCSPLEPRVGVVGERYLLLEPDAHGAALEPSRATSGGLGFAQQQQMLKCLCLKSGREFLCKTVPLSSSSCLLGAHARVSGHAHINAVHEVVRGAKRFYVIFPTCENDLHSYVRVRRRLKEAQARVIFQQIVSAVHEAHAKGIVLRDLKLRKFVFANEARLELVLESLEDSVLLDDPENDLLSDKHGCPAYVSPEILKCNTHYSGRAADMWGLGVMLYTMLVGRYPFHGHEHAGLFAKIRRGTFTLPESLSSRAKCLIRCLLRKEPNERLTTEDVLAHPWLTQIGHREKIRRLQPDPLDQCVPDLTAPARPENKKATKA